MARDKITISLDRTKADEAARMVGAPSTSAVIDVALDRLLRAERLRRDIDAYRRQPPTAGETAIAALGDSSGVEDDTDWELLYAQPDGE
jgi:hypothetical protein